MNTSHWVFGYGSLIWRPGFEFIDAMPARLEGWHRSLCVLSHKYRGTRAQLGLVFGLDQGGFCNGLAYEVAHSEWPKTYAYLTDRELVTDIYKEMSLSVALKNGEVVDATTYVVDQTHEQYFGKMPLQEVLALVRQGHGEAGSCIDYVRNTAEHLGTLGIPDPELDAIVRQL
jgi:glutathione-specific gamma-glutamylcyclotransferase